MKRHAACGLAGVCGLALSAWGQCENPVWSPEFGSAGTGLSGQGYAILVFDADGGGPLPAELYVGGYFQNAAGLPGTRGIAKWNGTAWSSVGGGVGPSGGIGALCTYDADGAGSGPPVLVAAGYYSTIGGVAANHIASWNGTDWVPFGSGLTGMVGPLSVVEYDFDGPGPELPQVVVAGGTFEVPAAALAWRGGAWVRLPDPYSSEVHELTVFDEDGNGPQIPSLFVGARHGPGILKFAGTHWETVGGGLSTRSGVFRCDCLEVVDDDGPGPQRPTLWVGGWFTHAGGESFDGLVRWTGQGWLARPPGIAGWYSVHDIKAVDYTNGSGAPDVYVSSPMRLDRFNPRTGEWTTVGLTEFGKPPVRHVLAPYRTNESQPSVYVTGLWTDYNGVESNFIARLRCGTCYANCDESSATPRLTGNDFMCFLDRFAMGSAYANCDGSTGTPNLTANDFQCFVNQYAAGCS